MKNVLTILTSTSKKTARQNIRTINYKLAQGFVECDHRYICYNHDTGIISLISSVKNIENIVKFTNSVDHFLRSISEKLPERIDGILLSSKQISELRLQHNTDKL